MFFSRQGSKIGSAVRSSMSIFAHPARPLATGFNYDVNATIKKEIYPEFRQWIADTIQDKMLKLEGFQRAEICEVRMDPTNDSQEMCVRYTVDTAENFERYVKNDAAIIRAEAVKKFGDKFTSKLSIYTSQVVLQRTASAVDDAADGLDTKKGAPGQF